MAAFRTKLSQQDDGTTGVSRTASPPRRDRTQSPAAGSVASSARQTTVFRW